MGDIILGTSVKIKGGDKWRNALAEYMSAEDVSLQIGIFPSSTYDGQDGGPPSGTPVASIAAVHEFGGVINMPARTQTLYFKKNKDGKVKNKFVKKKSSNFAQDANVSSHTIIIPMRSFLRSTFKEKGNDWIKAAGLVLKGQVGKDVHPRFVEALSAAGEIAVMDIKAKIDSNISPKLADSTIRGKVSRGKTAAALPEKPLVDTGKMYEAIEHKVKANGTGN